MKPHQYRRLVVLSCLLLAGFTGLGVKLVDLQLLRSDTVVGGLPREPEGRIVATPARRGDIKDRRDTRLATALPLKTVWADPSLIGAHSEAVARALAPVLGLSEAALARTLTPRRVRHAKTGEEVDLQYVVLKRRVSLDEWRQVTNTLAVLVPKIMEGLACGVSPRALPAKQRTLYYRRRSKLLSSISADDDGRRSYSHGSLAAHVLGFMGEANAPRKSPWDPVKVGKSGVERLFDRELSGVPGWREIIPDRNGREVQRALDCPPQPGWTVVLTIDAGLQSIVESEMRVSWEQHQPEGMSAVVVEVRTGKILALANLPTFDPNDLTGVDPAAFRNRAIMDLYDPGSTCKVLAIAAAINEGLVDLDTVLDCSDGRVRIDARTVAQIRDDHAQGRLTLAQVVSHSSNIGAAQVGVKLGRNRLEKYLRDFGLGARTGIWLAGEQPGAFSPGYDRTAPAYNAHGYGLAVNAVQMTMAVSAIANGGLRMWPMLIERLEDASGRTVLAYAPHRVRQVVSAETARKVTEAMIQVMTEGTGRNSQLEHYRVAGKTGTSQKRINGRYSASHHISSFIGFFPADDPEICIYVVMDDPRRGYYGAATAAPLFKRIAERAAVYLPVDPRRPGSESWLAGMNRSAEPGPGPRSPTPGEPGVMP